MHFRNVKQMTSYLMFDVYRFSNMILANEHRSLGPIFWDRDWMGNSGEVRTDKACLATSGF